VSQAAAHVTSDASSTGRYYPTEPRMKTASGSGALGAGDCSSGSIDFRTDQHGLSSFWNSDLPHVRH
jgi:hypothetical protein